MCFSVDSPMAMFSKASVRPSYAIASSISIAPYLKPSRDFGQQVRGVGHGLLAAGDHDVELAGADQLVGQRDGVEARTGTPC